ncbi:MAG: hypothetical protein ABIR13_00125 [Polaromonas sp.]
MKSFTARDRYMAMFLAVMSLILLGVLLWEWGQGKQLERELLKMRTLPVTPVPPQKILPEFTLPDKDAGFPEILARPVFSVSRRPPSVVAKETSAMKKGQFVLVGVLISPGTRAALLRDVATGKVQTVSQSAVVRGMTLSQVQPDRALLRLSDESEELPLNVQTGPKLVAPQRVPVAPGQPAPGLPGLAPASSAPATAPKPQVPASAAMPAAAASAPQPAASAPLSSASRPAAPPLPPPAAAQGTKPGAPAPVPPAAAAAFPK